MEIKTKFKIGDRVIFRHEAFQLPQIFIVSGIGTHTSSDEKTNFLVTDSKIVYELFPISFGACSMVADEENLILATKEAVEEELGYAVAKIKEDLLNKCLKE